MDNRFDRFFGFARPWSSDHYVIYENIKAPRVRFDLQPTQKLGLEASYAWFWLASSTDRLFDSFDGNISVRRIPVSIGTGPAEAAIMSGAAGIALTLSARTRVNTSLGYSHFIAGDFVKNE